MNDSIYSLILIQYSQFHAQIKCTILYENDGRTGTVKIAKQQIQLISVLKS